MLADEFRQGALVGGADCKSDCSNNDTEYYIGRKVSNFFLWDPTCENGAKHPGVAPDFSRRQGKRSMHREPEAQSLFQNWLAKR
jgi:hypothetical protein